MIEIVIFHFWQLHCIFFILLLLFSGESEEHLWKHEEPSRSNASLRQPRLQKLQQGHLAHLIPRLWAHTGKYSHTQTNRGNICAATASEQFYRTFILFNSENCYWNGLRLSFCDRHDFFCCCYYQIHVGVKLCQAYKQHCCVLPSRSQVSILYEVI